MTDPTNAERQRRYIARLKARATVTNDAAPGAVSNGEKKELSELRDAVSNAKLEIAALKLEIARWKMAHLALAQAPRRPKPIWTPVKYMQILKCLHPDNSASDGERTEAFKLLEHHKSDLVIGEAEKQARKSAEREREQKAALKRERAAKRAAKKP